MIPGAVVLTTHTRAQMAPATTLSKVTEQKSSNTINSEAITLQFH